MIPKVYVISKVRYAERWRFLRDRAEGLVEIVSTWIDEGEEDEIDFWEAWPRYLSQASTAAYALVYIETGETLRGGMAELGAALSHGAIAYVDGDVASLRTLGYHPHVHHARLDVAIETITLASGGMKGRYVNEYA